MNGWGHARNILSNFQAENTMYSTGMDNIDGGKWVLALEWLVVVGVFVLLATGPAKEGADEDTEYEKEIVGRTIRGPVAKTELEPGQLSWLADAIEGGDEAGAEFVRWANDLAEAEEIQRAIALASNQGAK